MAAIEFDGVWKKFRRGEQHDSLRDLIPSMVKGVLGRSHKNDLDKNDFWVLRDVSFKVERGEALGIIGQNGAGKSTTLKLLTRILKPTRGTCHLHGRVGALIEIAAGFHPDLTGRENVFLQGAIMGMRREEIRRHFDEIVEFAQLAEFIDTPVKRYSSGMNARLGFAIAANLEPDVLLIDEVLAVGDFTFQQKCYEQLKEFKRRGVAIAFVSHNLQAVASLCTRAIMLRRGDAPLVGPVQEVVSAYAGTRATVSDSRITVLTAQLGTVSGVPLTDGVSPGDQLRLDVNLRSNTELPRCGVAFRIDRSDGTTMFYGASHIGDMLTADVRTGSEFSFSVSFTAHLLKGTYMVSAQLVDQLRVWPIVTLSGLGAFVVTETTRIDGCAELYPNYRLQNATECAPADAVNPQKASRETLVRG